ncbi:hypothetical protein BGZ60DRAFT_392571, partial [Tricladium varicosporioides]
HSGPQPGNYITLGTVLSVPFSRGNIYINSTDVSAPASIDPKYMSHPMDLEVFSRHMFYLQTIARSEPFKEALSKDGVHQDEQYLYVAPSDTASMLLQGRGGVVETNLVYGTFNLCAIDASFFPLIPWGDFQASVYTVAERAADIIKAVYKI